MACHFFQLHAVMARVRALAKEVKSSLRQAKALNKMRADNFRKRRGRQKVIYRLRGRAVEATRRKRLEADRLARLEMGCRLLARSLANAMTTMVATKFARWKAELVGRPKAVGVDAEEGNGSAEPRRRNGRSWRMAWLR